MGSWFRDATSCSASTVTAEPLHPPPPAAQIRQHQPRACRRGQISGAPPSFFRSVSHLSTTPPSDLLRPSSSASTPAPSSLQQLHRGYFIHCSQPAIIFQHSFLLAGQCSLFTAGSRLLHGKPALLSSPAPCAQPRARAPLLQICALLKQRRPNRPWHLLQSRGNHDAPAPRPCFPSVSTSSRASSLAPLALFSTVCSSTSPPDLFHGVLLPQHTNSKIIPLTSTPATPPFRPRRSDLTALHGRSHDAPPHHRLHLSTGAASSPAFFFSVQHRRESSTDPLLSFHQQSAKGIPFTFHSRQFFHPPVQ